jgi:hypothetical protein
MESRGESRVVRRPRSRADGGAQRRQLNGGAAEGSGTTVERARAQGGMSHVSIRESSARRGGPGLGRCGPPWPAEDAGGVRRRTRGRSARARCAGSKGAWGACGLGTRLDQGPDAEKGWSATQLC